MKQKKEWFLKFVEEVNENVYLIKPEAKKVINGVFSNKREVFEVIISEGIEEIEDSAFSSCSSLKKIVLPSTLRKIGPSAFVYCSSLKEYSLPNNLEFLGVNAFCNCIAATGVVEVPNTVKIIEDGAFANNYNLEKIIFHNTLESVGNEVLYGLTYNTEIEIERGMKDSIKRKLTIM